MVRAWISIGSNIDARTNVAGAVARLRETCGAVVLSPLYETIAVGFQAPPFLNLVAGVETELPAGELMHLLSEIESQFGRLRGPDAFSSRTLDLDLLTYGDSETSANGKTLPRNDILKYAFVLKPLADVAPKESHPVDERTYAELWTAFTGDRSGLKPLDGGFLESVASGKNTG